MKNILVPTDFSATADHAIRFAAEVAEKVNAKLYLLHSMEYNGVGPLEPDGTFIATSQERHAVQRLLKQGEKRLANYTSKYNVGDTKIEKVLGLGEAEKVILQKIEELDIDLVIMGTNGASGLEEFLIGSNTEKVVRRALCPVITVKNRTRISDIKQIVFGSDFIDVKDKVIVKVKRLQELFDAELSIVRINTQSNFTRDSVIKPFKNNLLKKFNSEHTTIQIYNDITLEDGLRNFANEINGNMIALATNGRIGLSHLLAGSLAEDLLNHTAKVVWTAHL